MRLREITFFLGFILVVPGGVNAQPSRVEKKRQEILDKLGLDRVPAAKPVPADPPQAEPKSAGDEPAAAAEPTKAKPAAPPFKQQIHPWLVKSCQPCHQQNGPAGSTGFLLGRGVAADHTSVFKHVNVKAAARSPLVLEATGNNHGGGTVAAANAPQVRRLIAWINAGALLADPPTDDRSSDVPRVMTPVPPRSKRAAKPPVATEPVASSLPQTQSESEIIKQDAVNTPTTDVASSTAASATPQNPAPVAYSEAVHAVVTAQCRTCHSVNGMAARSRFLLLGDVASDYVTTRAVTTPGNAETSPLIAKASGQSHMAVVKKGSHAYRTIADWINAGAPGPFPVALTSGEVIKNNASSAAPIPAATTTLVSPLPPPAAPHPHGPQHQGGISLPLHLRLNGRFDMAFERRGLRDHPFASGQTQFQNYHHFLFLSRDEASDPIGFTAELVALTFWEAHVRVTPREWPWQLRLKVGKLIVPFGAEPLFHQSYGGLQGFDQKVLPVFWAQNGFGARFNARGKDLSMMGDVYAIRGYGLREEASVLNLQSEFSPNDDVRPAYGMRLNLSWRSISAYYSLLINGLGFGRTLALQALDISSWRWHGVPLLERITLGFGFLRADVSGAGAGSDYYHFASYYQARFYVTDSLYLQYRQGLRTFNNRRGVYQDTTRFTAEDGSAHNVGLVWRRGGLSIGAFQFWNLEKANEVRDDFFRVMVAYDF